MKDNSAQHFQYLENRYLLQTMIQLVAHRFLTWGL